MIKKRLLVPEDRKCFEGLHAFPGTEGNPFDRFLRILDLINQIPSILFIFLVIFLCGILTIFNLRNWFLLLSFSIIDILFIIFLPKLRISFGDYKSQVFLLLLLRAIFIWLPFPINLIFQCLGVLLVIYGFYVEPSRINLTRIDYRNNLPSPFLKFIHIADIHLEYFGKREEKLINLIDGCKPDFILFSGDFLNLSNIRNKDSIYQVINLFNQINKKAPVYYVSGSSAVDLEETILQIDEMTHAKRLDDSNQVLTIKEISLNLIGITCTHNPHFDCKKIPALQTIGMKNILLYHSPDLIYELEPENEIDIVLSGHTHGGQVRLPGIGALFTGSLYGRKLQSGLYQFYDTLMYISRGIGLEGLGAPRVRFLCPPEVIEWKIN